MVGAWRGAGPGHAIEERLLAMSVLKGFAKLADQLAPLMLLLATAFVSGAIVLAGA